MAPQVSVIIPTYNRAKVLPLAIRSVVNQTLRSWELVVVDDCSTDNTQDVVRERFGADPRIRLVKTPFNSKQGAARNLGVEKSTAPYIAFLDSDDTYHPEFLAKQMEKYSGSPSTLGLSYCGAYISDGKKTLATIHPRMEGWVEKALFADLKGLCASNSGVVIPRDVFVKVGGYDASLKSQDDLDLFVRIARHYRVSFIDGAYSTLLEAKTNHRISDSRQLEIEGERQLLDKHEARLREIGMFHHVARKLSRKYAVCSGSPAKAYSLIFKAIAYRPAYLYAYLYLLKLPFLYLKK